MSQSRSSLNTVILKSVGSRLRTLRRTKQLTLAKLARKSGVEMATISRIERGQMIGTLESHVRLSRALSVHLSTFYAELDHALKLAGSALTRSAGSAPASPRVKRA